MDVIDGNWIKQRLTGERGEQAALARALGITQAKVSLTLKGTRNVQPSEVPKLLEFFNEGPPPVKGMSEATAEPFKASADRLKLICDILAPDIRHPQVYRASADADWLGVREGDLLLVDLGADAEDGQEVIAGITSDDGAETVTRVFQIYANWLISRPGRSGNMRLGDSQNVALRGVVRGFLRSNGGEVAL